MRVDSLPYFNIYCYIRKMNIMGIVEMMENGIMKRDEENEIVISMSVVSIIESNRSLRHQRPV